jgi:hypothetical protein
MNKCPQESRYTRKNSNNFIYNLALDLKMITIEDRSIWGPMYGHSLVISDWQCGVDWLLALKINQETQWFCSQTTANPAD